MTKKITPDKGRCAACGKFVDVCGDFTRWTEDNKPLCEFCDIEDLPKQQKEPRKSKTIEIAIKIDYLGEEKDFVNPFVMAFHDFVAPRELIVKTDVKVGRQTVYCSRALKDLAGVHE